MVFPKNPASQKQNSARSSSGSSNQLIRARSTLAEITHAAAARIARVNGNNGHHAGLTAQTRIASGTGIVNNCPR